MPRPYKAIVVAAAAITAVGLSPLASFADDKPAPAAPTAAVTLDLAPGMLAAMRRDLKLDDDQIADRLRTEAAAPAIEKRLRAQLGKAYGGAWIPAGADRLTVAVTTEPQPRRPAPRAPTPSWSTAARPIWPQRARRWTSAPPRRARTSAAGTSTSPPTPSW